MKTMKKNNMIKLQFFNELSRELIDQLWEQKVCMDDWDYGLFIESSEELLLEHDLENLLHGCCYNKWYFVKDFKGKSGMLGLAYHA